MSILVGVIINETLGMSFFTLGLSVGIAVILMFYLKVMHPPARSNPFMPFIYGSFIWIYFFPVIAGSIIIILMSILINKFILKRNYPTKGLI